MTKLNQVTKETKYDLNQKKTQMNEVNFCLDYVGTKSGWISTPLSGQFVCHQPSESCDKEMKFMFHKKKDKEMK
jgi:hypothetical protein